MGASVAWLVGCGEPGSPGPVEFPACSDSPTELLRLEGVSAGLSVDAFDLGNAISVRYALQSEADPSSFRYPEVFSVVDNCGGAPVRLADNFDLPSGAANVGGDVVLCAGRGDVEDHNGVWELLNDGTHGEELGLGTKCDRANAPRGVRDPSFGIVHDAAEAVTRQFLPDGTSRVVSEGSGFELVAMRGGVGAFSFGEPATIHPVDGGAPISVELPEAVYSVYPAPGTPAASEWVIALPRPRPPGSADYEQPVAGYAIDLTTGEWFQTPEVILEVPGRVSDFSIRDGLMATRVGDGVALSRAGWGAHRMLASFTGFAVLDANRLFTVGTDELRIYDVPLEFPSEDEPLEVSWSRPLEDAEAGGRGGGMLWNEMALVWSRDFSSDIWAYPLDGRPGFPFMPVSGDAFLHVGERVITGLDVSPGSGDDAYRLYERSFDGELEIIAENLASGQDDFMGHPWTPELGRILYTVRDGDSVSVRQHRLPE